MSDVKHSETALLRGPIGTVITAVLGFIVAAVSLLVFVFELLVTPEIGALIVSFVVCGIGLTTGFIVLRRLAPRREPETLFSGSCGVIVPTAPGANVPVQKIECLPESVKSASRVHSNAQITPVMKSHGSESIATYKTHGSSGALVFTTAIGVSLVLGGRLRGGWEFLSLAVLAGCALALVLHWRQGPGVSEYRIPATGGVIGAAALAGVGLVMVRFHFLRDFLGLAVAVGGVIALVLNWSRRRTENSGGPFL